MKDTKRLKDAILKHIGSWKEGYLAGAAEDGIHCYIRGKIVVAEYFDGSGRIETTYAKAQELRQTNLEL